MYQLLYKLNEQSDYRIYDEYESREDKSLIVDTIELLEDGYILKLLEV